MLVILLLTCCLNAPLEVTIDSETLSLGQIVPLAASDARASVAMGYSPAPGAARRISRQEISARIQAAGLATDGLEFPESILVHRRSVALRAEQVKQAVLTAFIRQFPDANVDLINVDVPVIEVGTGDVTVNASLPPKFDPGQPVFVKLEVRSSASSRTVFARTSVKIETIQPVVVTRILANSELKAADVEWKPAPLEGNGATPASLDGLEGMMAKRDLEPGQILKMDLLYMPLYVRKGETVTVKATSGGVTIAATMRALAAGRLGDTIPVQHLTGSGNANARVIGLRTLEALQR